MNLVKGFEDELKDRCLTCQGRVWVTKLGRFVDRRETTNLVCETCGWDYSQGEKKDEEVSEQH